MDEMILERTDSFGCFSLCVSYSSCLALTFSLLQWVAFDDDNVYPVEEEDIKKLDGGGDWHMAYVLV